jgi:hypothetical protein
MAISGSFKHPLHRHGTSGQVPQSYWLVVLSIIMAGPVWLYCWKGACFQASDKTHKWRAYVLNINKTVSTTTRNLQCYTEDDEPIGWQLLPAGPTPMQEMLTCCWVRGGARWAAGVEEIGVNLYLRYYRPTVCSRLYNSRWLSTKWLKLINCELCAQTQITQIGIHRNNT